MRIVNLNKIPIFGDEALYLYLADSFLSDNAQILEGFKYGVFPIGILLYTPAIILSKFFFDPLILGRSISIIFELISAFFVFKIGSLIDKRVAYLSVIIYSLLPLSFFHSRFALLDQLSNTFVLISVWLTLKGVYRNYFNNLNFKYIFLIGFLISLAFFIKPIAVLAIPAIFLTCLSKLGNNLSKRVILHIFLNFLILAVFLGIVFFYFYLPASNQFTKYITDSTSSLLNIFEHTKLNLFRSKIWLSVYLTPVIFTLTIFSIIFIFFKKNLTYLWVIFWFVSVLIIASAYSANFYPRHLYQLAAPVSFIISYTLVSLFKDKLIIYLVLSLVLIQSLLLNLQIIFNPTEARLAGEDRQQFFEDSSSGTGIKEIAAKLNEVAKSDSVVFVEDDPSQFWVLKSLYPVNAKIIRSNNLSKGGFIEESLISQTKSLTKYLVLNKNQVAQPDWPVELVSSYPKGPNRTINLYLIH